MAYAALSMGHCGQLACQRWYENPIDGAALLVAKKPTGQWEKSNKKTVRQLFTIGAKTTEDDFAQKSRYIKYVFGESLYFF